MSAPLLIYGLIDPTEGTVRYIGASTTGMRRPRFHGRPSEIAKAPKTPKNQWLQQLQASGRVYRVSILEEVTSKDDLYDAEMFWIAQGRALGWPLTNRTNGGIGPNGCVHSEETRAKASAIRKGKRRPPFSSEWRANLAAAKRGFQHSQETRRKMSAARKGRPAPPRSESWCKRHAELLTGRKHSEETRAKMAASQKARRDSERLRRGASNAIV